MVADWTNLCQISDFEIEGDTVVVPLPFNRMHIVSVRDADESFLLTSVVVKAAITKHVDALALQTWERNRATQLVGFRIDSRQRLIGEAWVPKSGLTASEFVTYVRAVAVESDRFEFLLTGSDAT